MKKAANVAGTNSVKEIDSTLKNLGDEFYNEYLKY